MRIAASIEEQRMLSSTIPPRSSTMRFRPVRWIRASSNNPTTNFEHQSHFLQPSGRCHTVLIRRLMIVPRVSSLSATLGSRILLFTSRMQFAFMM